jgi:hypothetical protein
MDSPHEIGMGFGTPCFIIIIIIIIIYFFF